MPFIPTDRYLWDFWFAPRAPGEPYHLFFLQASRTLAHPDLRHKIATVGHAVSPDLRHWEMLPTAFEPGLPGVWDDQAIWTGSIIKHEATYYFFYAALQSEGGWNQQIGLATSPDLMHWERHPANPVVVADARWYEKLPPDSPIGEACRDAWVVRDGPLWYMFFTARANHGPSDGRGVVGLARSSDLVRWEQLPPAAAPGHYDHMEVPQIVPLNGQYLLFFCSNGISAAGLTQIGLDTGWKGTHYLTSANLTGPYLPVEGPPLVGDLTGTYYAGRVVDGPDGQPHFMAWRQWAVDGTFVGGLSDPAPLRVLPDGRLAVDQAQLWPDMSE